MELKHKYRGQLTKGNKMVDIFDFEGEIAKCDHKMGDIDINEFNSIFVPMAVFKELMNMESKTTTPIVKKKSVVKK